MVFPLPARPRISRSIRHSPFHVWSVLSSYHTWMFKKSPSSQKKVSLSIPRKPYAAPARRFFFTSNGGLTAILPPAVTPSPGSKPERRRCCGASPSNPLYSFSGFLYLPRGPGSSAPMDRVFGCRVRSAAAAAAVVAAAAIAAAVSAPAVPAAAAAQNDDQDDDPQAASAAKTVIAAPH